MATICQILFIILLTLTTVNPWPAAHLSPSGDFAPFFAPLAAPNGGCFLVSCVFFFFSDCLSLTLATSKLGIGME